MATTSPSRVTSRLSPKTVRIAVESILSPDKLIRRAGVVGWPAEDWDAARKLMEELDAEERLAVRQ